jgi:hypothetical protein
MLLFYIYSRRQSNKGYLYKGAAEDNDEDSMNDDDYTELEIQAAKQKAAKKSAEIQDQ